MTGRAMWRRYGVALASLALALGASATGLASQDLAIVGGTVHPVSGPPMENATIVIEDGVITGVGAGLAVPDGVQRIDATGMIVTPGLFDAYNQLGLVEVSLESTTRDFALADDPVTVAFDVLDGLNPHSTLIPINRVGGLTTVATMPSGGLVAGQGAVIDLAGATVDEMLVQPRAALAASFGPSAASATGGARGAAALRLRELLDDARFWAANQTAFDQGAARPLAYSRLDLAALQPVLSGEVPLIIEVDRSSDILTVLRIADEYGIQPVIRSGAEAWMVADQLSAAGVPVIVKPLTNRPLGFERLGARFDNAALLYEAGVPIAISSFQTHRAHNLPQEAGNAVRFGLPWEAALEAVTFAPARIYGLADRYGTIEPGKVGNVVVWTGDPFELSSRPEVVVVRGLATPAESRQTELMERYRTLEMDTPPAYRGGRAPARTP